LTPFSFSSSCKKEYLATRARLRQFSQRTKPQQQEGDIETSHQQDIETTPIKTPTVNSRSSHHGSPTVNSRNKVAEGAEEASSVWGSKEVVENVSSKQSVMLETSKRHSHCEKEVSRMESLLTEVRESFEVSLRTAGLRKGRENALLDELGTLFHMIKELSSATREAGISAEALNRTKLEMDKDKHFSALLRTKVEEATKEATLKAEAIADEKLQVTLSFIHVACVFICWLLFYF
jgi:hypothetical protein